MGSTTQAKDTPVTDHHRGTIWAKMQGLKEKYLHDKKTAQERSYQVLCMASVNQSSSPEHMEKTKKHQGLHPHQFTQEKLVQIEQRLDVMVENYKRVRPHRVQRDATDWEG